MSGYSLTLTRRAALDLIDAVDWAIAQRIAVPARVAIYGASYGGYAALVGAAFTPENSPVPSISSASRA